MPMQDNTRPEGVKITTAAMVAVLVVEFLLGIYTLHRVARMLADSSGGFRLPSFFSGGISLISIAIAAVFVFLYWQGNNVGRWAVLIDSGFVILNAFFSLFSMLFFNRFQSRLGLGPVVYLGGLLNLLKACMAGYFFWYLNQPAIKAWFVAPKDGTAGYPPQGYVPPYGSQPAVAYPPPVTPYATPDVEPEPAKQEPPPPASGFTV